MIIDVYADVVCPWCYIGARRLSRALAQRPDLEVERRWQPFQLQPDLPKSGIAWASFVQQKFGGQAQAAFAQVSAAGAADGLIFNFDRVVNALNTRDLHRLIVQAPAAQQWPLAEALFRAYFTDGQDLTQPAQLEAVVTGAGLPASLVQSILASDVGGAEVDASQAAAYRNQVRSVPFYVLDNQIAVSGAQPVAVFLQALDHVAGATAQS